MNSRQYIENQFKDIALPSGEAKVEKIKIELLMDIRDLVSGMLSIQQSRENIEAARRAREIAASQRHRKEEVE